MKKYCFVIKLKKEHIEEYIEIHRNVWPEMLQAIQKAGAKEETLYIYEDLSIVTFECEDLDEVYKKLGEEDIVKKWDATVSPWFESISPPLEKIFDLKQQLNGKLEQF